MKIIDEIILEPLGGAHRNKEQAALFVKEALTKYLKEFKKYNGEEILQQRKKKFLNIGTEKTLSVFSKGTNFINKENFTKSVKGILFRFKKELIIVAFVILVTALFLF